MWLLVVTSILSSMPSISLVLEGCKDVAWTISFKSSNRQSLVSRVPIANCHHFQAYCKAYLCAINKMLNNLKVQKSHSSHIVYEVLYAFLHFTVCYQVCIITYKMGSSCACVETCVVYKFWCVYDSGSKHHVFNNITTFGSNWCMSTLTMSSLKPPLNFKYYKLFFSSSPMNVYCSPSDGLGDGSFTPAFSTKIMNKPLGSTLLQFFDIMCKGKHPFHFSKRTLWTSTSNTIVNDWIQLLISLKIFLPKILAKRNGSSIRCFRMFELLWVEAIIKLGEKMTK